VISGSYREGGSIAWAIPVKYASGMKAVRLPPSRLNPWPPLTLMATSWKTLRSDASPGAALVVAVNHYARIVDEINGHWTVAVKTVRRLMPNLRNRIALVDEQIAARGEGFVIDRDRKLAAQLARLVDPQTAKNLIELANRFQDDAEAVETSGRSMFSELEAYLGRLPATRKNLALKAKASKRVNEAGDAITAMVATMPKSPDGDVVTLGDYKKINGALVPFGDWFLDSPAFQRMIHELRNIADVIEAIFEAEPDRAP